MVGCSQRQSAASAYGDRADDGTGIVYGYFRVAADDPDTETVLHGVLDRFCADKGFVLGDVFADRDVAADAVTRDGMDALAGALARNENVSRVVVPTFGHLSTAPAVLTALLTAIHALGADVVAVEDAVPAPGTAGVAARADPPASVEKQLGRTR